jgi:hypothetical protein
MWCGRSVRCISSRSRPSRRLSPEICSIRLSRWYKVVLRCGARGIGHLLPGEVPEPVSDPHETEQQPPAPDRHAQPLPQLQHRILRHITRPGQSGDLLVPYVFRPGPAVQQRPDARRVRIAEVLARGDQPQIAIIDQDRASEASGQPVRKCLNLLDAHSSPSATSVTNPDQT